MSNPEVLSVRIKQSKTDPFRQGVTIHMGKTGGDLCPVAALRKVLAQAGFKPEDYAGHSFRIGAATTAAACGIPADTIKTLGRWKSQAYQLYVRLPRKQLASISCTLATKQFQQ